MQYLFHLTVEEFEQRLSTILDQKLAQFAANIPEAKPKEELIKIDAAAKCLHVTTRTINTWKESILIPFHFIGSRIFYKKSELENALLLSNKKK